MIIFAILALAAIVLGTLFALVALFPEVPTTFLTVIRYVLPHVARGVRFVNGFMYPNIVWPLATVCLAMHAFYVSYRLVMWVYEHVPLFGMGKG